MEPSLAGPHFLATCPQCSASHRIAAEFRNLQLPVGCQRCGAACEITQEILQGDRVLVDQSIDTQDLKRFDLLAFTEGGKSAVKRIWGMPREKVRIRDGEVMIDGKLLQKSLAQLKAVAIPVASTWLPIDSGQKGASVAFVLQAAYPDLAGLRDAPDRAFLNHSWIVDDYACDQGLSYQTQRVHDYALELSLSTPMALVELQLNVYGRALNVRFSRRQSESVNWGWQGDSLILPMHDYAVIAVCDGRILAGNGWGEQDPLSVPVDSIKEDLAAWDMEPGIACIRAAHLESVHAKVVRDLYIRTDTRTGTGESAEDTSDGFFLLGDNQPSSVDSRNGLGRVLPQNVLGIVRRVD